MLEVNYQAYNKGVRRSGGENPREAAVEESCTGGEAFKTLSLFKASLSFSHLV